MPTISTTSVEIALVHQHLVDDELEEDRRRQREQLHEQRGDHDLRQRLAVAQDRGQEPAEAEGRGIEAGAGEAPCHQDDFAIPNRRDLLARGIPGGLLEDVDQPEHTLLRPGGEFRSRPS